VGRKSWHEDCIERKHSCFSFLFLKDVMMKCYLYLSLCFCVGSVFAGVLNAQEVKQAPASSGCPCATDSAEPEASTGGDLVTIPVSMGPLISVTLLREASERDSTGSVDGVMIDFLLPALSDLPFGIGERFDAWKHNGCWVKITEEVDIDGDGTVDTVLNAWRFKTPCPLYQRLPR